MTRGLNHAAVQRDSSSGVRTLAGWAALDALVIVIFAAIGRRSHDEANAIAGALSTAWPFLVGAAVGWVVALARRRPPVDVRSAVPVWLGALVVGMLLRVLTGAGTALSFVLVAGTFLALFLLLPRLIATRSRRG